VEVIRLTARSVRVLAVPVLVAGVAAGVVPAPAALARPAGPAASFSINGLLSAVAATSAANAWAVGYSGGRNGVTKTLILRWNGTAWK
jgi:uncharacterized RDD family membrane protein YckC